jgi:hypothetical protein
MERVMPEAVRIARPHVPRAVVAWTALMLSSAVAVGALALAGGWSPAARASSAEAVREWRIDPQLPVSARAAASTRILRVTPKDAPLVAGRWRAVVVHFSGTPAGDAMLLDRLHTAAGLRGLGHHFVIGNGQGMEDGLVLAGPRWDRQQPGAHAAMGWRATVASNDGAAPASTWDADFLNRHAVSICLIGNPARRPATARQEAELAALVAELQRTLDIPPGAVLLASDLARAASGPERGATVGTAPVRP